ncbi:MAG TPA: bifunctional NADH-specific enoyl-ACP reductase/trans-2-enoyl-CoA reductase [Porticoccaceae bacterium]|nr:bifunctional NADH-specific enoyl-ACP reductase/trans-2-enoyl-CoA reductase [Porticoccaceae bacterium]
MVIKPKVRGFICTNAHPVGCAAHVQEQIDYVKSKGAISGGPKRALIIGSSTGYGLASRITAAFGCGADTLGVFFEKPPTEKRTGSAGYYNTAAFQAAARKQGLVAEGINGDAFSDEVKAETISLLKDKFGPVDLVVYSLASPRRTDPRTGTTYTSALKPIGDAYTMKGVNTDTLEVDEVTVEPATEEEIAHTVKVMGGEDWEWWIEALMGENLLAEGCKSTAYTYIGKEMTWPLYGHAAIGMAKKDLDRAAEAIDGKLKGIGGECRVSVLKALVTQASSAIPIMPLYISILYKIMKADGSHEGCIQQIQGLFERQLYSRGQRDLDEIGRLRMDGLELRDSVQEQVKDLWSRITTENLSDLSDFEGYREEFLKLFGFGIAGVDYDADVSPVVAL